VLAVVIISSAAVSLAVSHGRYKKPAVASPSANKPLKAAHVKQEHVFPHREPASPSNDVGETQCVQKPNVADAVIVYEAQSRYPDIDDAERETLARLVWLEARGEGERGQQAVAEVVMNRVSDPRFPDTVNGVVFQTDPCLQFAPSGMIPHTTPQQAQYDAVDEALYGEPVLETDYVYFNTLPVTTVGVIRIGNHYFSK